MGRKPRVMQTGGLYHVIQRGNNRNYIYEDITDKKMFFKLLIEAKEKCGFRIVYYVLMDNHYHLVLESGEIPISTGIQRLNTAYSKYYNKKYSRSGGIYGGRFSSALISDNKYYFQLLKYIARNPIKAGIVKKADEYRWCAHAGIKAGDSNVADIDRMLSYFPGHKSKALREYIDLIEHDIEIKSDYGLMPVKEEQKINDSLDYILKSLGLTDDGMARIKKGDKSIELKSDKDRFIKEAFSAGFKVKDIARHISYTYEGVRKVVSK